MNFEDSLKYVDMMTKNHSMRPISDQRDPNYQPHHFADGSEVHGLPREEFKNEQDN